MTTLQTEFTEAELLAEHDIAEPLVVEGVRCHGGFDAEGNYCSPRTKNRWPAIHAWEAQHFEQFGKPLLDIPLDAWPENFPNVAQSKFLLSKGLRWPTIASLTRIGTVEGFGGMLRMIKVPEFSRLFDEGVQGTAIDHIDRGLFEAHARDEAGYGEEIGHDRMWFLARDIAFEHPPVEDETERMLVRMGIKAPPGAPPPAPAAAPAPPARALPADIDIDLETIASRMIGLLLIEISAFHGFAWAEAVLSDTDLVAGGGAAATLVSRIRADETPHVAWLRTALSEMRDRTWIGQSGRKYAGAEMVSRLWERAVEASLGVRRQETLRFYMGEIELAVAGRPDGADIIEEMLSLGKVVRRPDGTLGGPLAA
jgi:hypothetical protein